MSGFIHHLHRLGIVALLVGGLLSWQAGRLPTVQAATDGFDLTVWPKVIQNSQNYSNQHIIGLQGKNGFNGNVTVNVSGLPSGYTFGYTEPPGGFYYCSSSCLSTPNSDVPFSVPLKSGEFANLAPTFVAPSDSVPVGTYTVTITASSSGYVTKTDTFTLKVRDEETSCAPFGEAYPDESQSVKVSITAGQTVNALYALSPHVCIGSDEEGNPTNEYESSASYLTNGDATGKPGLGTAMGISLSPSSTSFSGPIDSTQANLVITTSTQTPNGTYVAMVMSRDGSGAYYPLASINILVTGGTTGTVAPTTPTPTSTPSATSTSQPTATPSASDTPVIEITESLEPETTSVPDPTTLPTEEMLTSDGPTELIRTAGVSVLLPMAVVTAGVTFVSLASLLAPGVSIVAWIGSLGLLLGVFFLNSLEWVGIRRRRYPWGVVFDGETGRPIELAIIRLRHVDGALIETRVTDRTGRFGFLAKPGVYHVEITKPGYRLALAGEVTHPAYEPLFEKDVIRVGQSNQVIAMNFALLPAGKSRGLPFGRLTSIFRRVLLVLTLLLAAAYYVSEPNQWVAAGIGLGFLVLLTEWLAITPKHVGIISDRQGRAISGVAVRLMSVTTEKTVATAVTDSDGRYSFLVRPGVYRLRLVNQDYTGPDWMQHGQKIVISDSVGGQIAPSFYVTKRAEQ